MGGGGTPRQQMIGLMYLVLLAMLAMNASKDLLNAFVMLEHGIDKTQGSFVQANSSFYNTIDKAAAGNAAAYGKTKKLADEKPVQATAGEKDESSARRVRRGRARGYASLMSDSRVDSLGGGSKLG